MASPTERTLHWRVASVSMYLFETRWFTVTLEKTGGGQPGDDDPEKIRYVTDEPPPVDALVRIAVEIVER